MFLQITELSQKMLLEMMTMICRFKYLNTKEFIKL
jgi:hypothetical protein